MKYLILLLCSILYLQAVQGQRTLFIPPDRTDTISSIYKIQRQLYAKLGLAQLQNDTADYSLRIATYSVVIDVWRKGARDTGVVTNWVREYVPANSKKPGRFFAKAHPLTPEQATSILRYKDLLKIDTIPDAFYIDNWPLTADGATYSIEHSDATGYYFKSYNNPVENDPKVQQSAVIANFIASVWFVTEAKVLSKQTSREIPFAHYYNSEGVVISRGEP